MRRRSAPWLPDEAAESLVQLAFVERGIAHILSGWAVKMPDFAAKRAFGSQLHRSIERATALRSRVTGLSHATARVATVAAGWRTLLSRIDRADSPEQLVAGLFGWLGPRLTEMYRAHVTATDADGDRASIELIESFLGAIRAEERARPRPMREARASRRWLDELDSLWESRGEGQGLALDEALWPPVDRVPQAARPPGLAVAEAGSLGLMPADPVKDPRGIAMFLHKEIDEEYTTLELIARNSYEHPEMPWAFHRDMARQASDEARHAEIIGRLMAARGVRHGDFALSTSSYDGLYAFDGCAPGSRDELLWRILVRQTFDEGLAIDSLRIEIDRRREAGQADIAAAFDYILRDEVFHAASGLRWSRHLAGGDAAAARKTRAAAVDHFVKRAEAAREAYVMANLDEAMAELEAVEAGRSRRDAGPRARPLNRTGRAQAGFDEDDLAQLADLGFSSD